MEKYSNEIRPILDCFDKITEKIKKSQIIDMPEIVVVGIQSSGKSSVLESISGIELPRGENIVTKCPIILQLRNALDNEEYAKIRYEGEEDNLGKTIKLEEVAAYIEKYQSELLAKTQTTISESGIYLTVVRKNSPDLTLKDLPGMFYTLDKTNDQANVIKNMYLKNITGSQVIILLVLTAENDINTSSVIPILGETNYYERTIPVITKIDKKVQEPKYFENIEKNELKLKHLPIVVRNKTQKEIEAKESSESIRKKERMLIDSIPELRNLPETSKGVDQLINCLVQLQKERLLNTRRTLNDTIDVKLTELKLEFSKMPKPINNIEDKSNAYIDCCDKLYKSYVNVINGNNDGLGKNIVSQIKEKAIEFKNSFEKTLDYFCTKEKYQKVSISIKNSIGAKVNNLMDQGSVFYSMMTQEIPQSENDILTFLHNSKTMLLNPLLDLCKTAFASYPQFSEILNKEFTLLLEKQLEQAQKLILQIFNLDRSILTLSKNYEVIVLALVSHCQSSISAIKSYPDNQLPNYLTPFNMNNILLIDYSTMKNAMLIFKDKTDYTKELEQLISMYVFNTVFSNRFCDYLFSCVNLYLIEFTMTNFQKVINKFSPSINATTQSLVQEAPEITSKRKILCQTITNLEESKEMLYNLFKL